MRVIWNFFKTFALEIKPYYICHCLDDFLFVGQNASNECNRLMQQFSHVCKKNGLAIAADKTIGPTIKIIYLGLGINTVSQPLLIPNHKVTTIND